jgi:hypothetical protein
LTALQGAAIVGMASAQKNQRKIVFQEQGVDGLGRGPRGRLTQINDNPRRILSYLKF